LIEWDVGKHPFSHIVCVLFDLSGQAALQEQSRSEVNSLNISVASERNKKRLASLSRYQQTHGSHRAWPKKRFFQRTSVILISSDHPLS
jgi:hypothetical protein